MMFLFFAGLDRDRGGAQLSKLPSDFAEKVGLWLGSMFLLQNWNLLGYQATAMGSKRKFTQILIA